MKSLIAALVLLTVSSAQAQNVTPAAADGTLGMAIMSSVVGIDGSLTRGSGAVATAREGTGSYRVTFERPINGCTLSAMSGAAHDLGTTTYAYAVSAYVVGDRKTVRISMRTAPSNAAVDAAFHLMVFCHQ